MTFPQQNLTVSDSGRGVVTPATRIPVYTGVSFGGSQAVNTRGSVADLLDVRDKIGYGALAEDVALALAKRGGPIYFIRHDSADDKELASEALTGDGDPVTVSGTPNDRYKLRVEIIASGGLGEGTFRYSLDAWDSDIAPFTQSRVRTIPVLGDFEIAGSGLTLTFSDGDFLAGDSYELECVPQEPGVVDLGAVAAALIADTAINFFLWIIAGVQPDETTGAAFASAFSGYLSTLAGGNRFARGLCDVGSDADAADVEAETASWTSSRICPIYGYEYRPSLLPFEGFSTRKTSSLTTFGARAAGVLISNDLSRTADGPDDGVLAIEFDGGQDQSLDAVKISTMRTWEGKPGFYIANAKLKSGFGSDFTDLQFGRVMDVACRTTSDAQFPFISDSLRTIGPDVATEDRPVGSIDARDARQIEDAVQGALADALLKPLNARGNPGHVSNVVYSVDRSTNLVATDQLFTRVRVRPLGYAKDIETTLGFSLNI